MGRRRLNVRVKDERFAYLIRAAMVVGASEDSAVGWWHECKRFV